MKTHTSGRAATALTLIALAILPGVQPQMTTVAAAAAVSPDESAADRDHSSGAIVCPVTGLRIASSDRAAGTSVYQGKSYYFCTTECKALFDKDPARFVAADADRKTGKQMFSHNCVSCHGDDGKGGFGPNLQRTTLAEAALATVIHDGRGKMPAYGHRFGDEDIRVLIAFLHAVHERPADSPTKNGS